MKYKILEGPSQLKLETKVYEHGKEGWHPVGEPVHTMRGWWRLIKIKNGATTLGV